MNAEFSVLQDFCVDEGCGMAVLYVHSTDEILVKIDNGLAGRCGDELNRFLDLCDSHRCGALGATSSALGNAVSLGMSQDDSSTKRLVVPTLLLLASIMNPPIIELNRDKRRNVAFP